MSDSWLCAYLTYSLHMWHKYNHEEMICQSRTIARSKDQRSRSHGSFKVFAVSAPWPIWLNRFIYNPWEEVSHTIPISKGHKCCVCTLAPRWFWQIRFIDGTNKTNEGTMCHATFSGQKLKVTWSFEVSVVSAPWLAAYLTKHSSHEMWLWHVHFQVKRSKVKVTWVVQIDILSFPLYGSLSIRPIRIIFSTNISHEVTMCHTPSPSQEVKGQHQWSHRSF